MLEIDEVKIAEAKAGKGFFIIATNEMDAEALPAKELLSVYKNGQQSVERGFRFLKDPRFMTSSIFLKKETRIIALALVMCLSLLIYTITQRKLRLELAKQGATILKSNRKTYQKTYAGLDLRMFWRSCGLLRESRQQGAGVYDEYGPVT